jgi:hypothetical protein
MCPGSAPRGQATSAVLKSAEVPAVDPAAAVEAAYTAWDLALDRYEREAEPGSKRAAIEARQALDAALGCGS